MGLEDFGKKINAIVGEREKIRTDIRAEILALRNGAQALNDRMDEIAKGRASTEYSKPFGQAGIEGEKITILEEIRALQDHADRLEKNFEAIVRGRTGLAWLERSRK